MWQFAGFNEDGSKLWASAPNVFACSCASQYIWPISATSRVVSLETVNCIVRIRGGCADYEPVSFDILLEALVFASDWPLTRTAHITKGTVGDVYGCPVTVGSPFGVAMCSSSGLILAGSVLELDLPNPERYKKGMQTLSVLVIGFYCAKRKWCEEGAVFHVSLLLQIQ